jgi:membrane fusion protein
MDEVEAQLDELRGQEDYLKLAISRQAARLKLNLETAQAARTLYEQQLTSAIQLRQREEALLASEQSLSDLQEKLDSFPKTIRRLDAQRGRLLAERSEANAAALITKAQIADRQRQVAAEASTVLKASAAGQIASLPARLGMSVSAGLPVATIVPATPQLEAELWIPSRAIGHLGPGKTARLMYDAFPYATYGTWQATIVAIDKVPTPPQFLPIPIKTEESLYRVRAKLSSQGIRTARQYSPLKSGMRLSADMVLEEKPIAGWIIDKFFAAAKRGTEARRS